MGKAEDRSADKDGQNVIQPIIFIEKVVHKDSSEDQFLENRCQKAGKENV